MLVLECSFTHCKKIFVKLILIKQNSTKKKKKNMLHDNKVLFNMYINSDLLNKLNCGNPHTSITL